MLAGGPRTRIDTARLCLRAPDEALTAATTAYLQRNAAHFAPWDPPLPADHAEPMRVAELQRNGRIAFAGGLALRWWLTDRHAPPEAPRVLGSVHLSGIVRGAFHNAALGYALDREAQGRGLMHEALSAVIDEAFGPRVMLHRLQAGVRPENARSLAVLRRLGFADEGLARRYLYIDGAWRDHRIFALLNPGFEVPEGWPRRD